MPFSFSGLVIAILSFAATYLVARTPAKLWRARGAKRKGEAVRAAESRQVRRARERGKDAR